MSDSGIPELQQLRKLHKRFRTIFVMLGLLSACLVTYLATRAATSELGWVDISVIGLLVFATLALSMAQMGCLRVLSNQAANQIEVMALFDDLTGVYNYRYMDYRLHEEISRANRSGRPLSLIYVDLDKFKRVNDLHGHQMGNDVLHRVGRVLKSSARDTDLVGRLGGDEFLVILPDTYSEQAQIVADRFCQALRTLRYRSREGIEIDYLRLSAGVAEYPRHAEDIDGLLSCADHAMYAAKKSGGDTFRVAPIPEGRLART